jgi:hypothetical protein
VKLVVDSDSRTVSVLNMRADLIATLGKCPEPQRLLRSVLRVRVVEEATVGEELPDVLGRHEVLDGGLRFTPHFPFEPGVRYCAAFDPGPLGCRRVSEPVTLEFSPTRGTDGGRTHVKHVFPSGEALPENLLRFYVCFSSPMQRGWAEKHIRLFGPSGREAPDVLYRPPAELWDRSMTWLTILLDPGRLKRWVGPNRELGPPLDVGQVYSLAIDSEMPDASGRPLGETFHKSFCVREAVRRPVRPEHWRIVAPKARSRRPVQLMFPEPLDWAQLWHAITIVSEDDRAVEGQIAIDRDERRWRFTPRSPWDSGRYTIRIASHLEDVCGNTLSEAFDGPIQPDREIGRKVTSHSIPCHATAGGSRPRFSRSPWRPARSV